MSGNSSLRRCIICKKTGNNCKSIITVNKPSVINKLRGFFDSKINDGDDACSNCINKTRHYNNYTVQSNCTIQSSETEASYNNITEFDNNEDETQIESTYSDDESADENPYFISKNENSLSLNLPKSLSNHNRCIVCRKEFRNQKKVQKQAVIGTDGIIDAYIETGIYIPKGMKFFA